MDNNKLLVCIESWYHGFLVCVLLDDTCVVVKGVQCDDDSR
jgi:hypothetical protein